MDGGAWWATVHGITKSWTRLSDFTSLHFIFLVKKEWMVMQIILKTELIMVENEVKGTIWLSVNVWKGFPVGASGKAFWMRRALKWFPGTFSIAPQAWSWRFSSLLSVGSSEFLLYLHGLVDHIPGHLWLQAVSGLPRVPCRVPARPACPPPFRVTNLKDKKHKNKTKSTTPLLRIWYLTIMKISWLNLFPWETK